MKLSRLFTKTTKDVPADETSKNAQLLIRAGFVHKTMAGVYSYLPLGLRVINKIENIVRKHMNSIGGQEILMNSLHPKAWWQKANRWDNVDILFKLKSQTGSDYALACSHEEQVVPIIQSFIHSYKNLPECNPDQNIYPLSVYQIQTKFRDELRAKSGILRGREFRMKDMYDFHATKTSQNTYYELVKATYFDIYAELDLKVYATTASGGIFTSNVSHEFQVECEAGEDWVYLDTISGEVYNEEVAPKEALECDYNSNQQTKYQKLKTAEIGNIFKLDDKYTKAFGVTVNDENNNPIVPLMNCHGIGTSRCMGVIAEIHSDEKGLKWPKNVAPFEFHLITNLDKADEVINQKILDLADRVYTGHARLIESETWINYENLTDRNSVSLSEWSRHIEVLWDDRKNIGLGEKLADADLIGCPVQLIISKRSLENFDSGVEVKLR